jgi:hypothetical protein
MNHFRHWSLVLMAFCACLGLEAQQPGALHLRGIVTDSNYRRAVAGAHVSLVGGRAQNTDTTDAKGAFDLTLIPSVHPGEKVRLRVEKTSYFPYDEFVIASDEALLQIQLSSTNASVPKTPAKVTLSPPRVDFGSFASRETVTFSLRNRSDDDVYSALLKFRINSETLSGNDFEVGIPPNSQKPISDQSGPRAGDIAGMKCRDQNGHPLIFLSIYRLTPGEFREVTLTRTKSGDAKVSAELSHYESTPQPVITESNRTGQPLVTDEPLWCDQMIGVLLPKTQGQSNKVSEEAPVLNAPNGIAISGGVVNNPTVNNYSPPQRKLLPDFKSRLSVCLSKVSGTVELTALMNDSEAYTYASDWLELFKTAQWSVKNGSISSFFHVGPVVQGLQFTLHGIQPANSNNPAVDSQSPEGNFAKCLTDNSFSGVTARIVADPQFPTHEVRVEVYSSPQDH